MALYILSSNPLEGREVLFQPIENLRRNARLNSTCWFPENRNSTINYYMKYGYPFKLLMSPTGAHEIFEITPPDTFGFPLDHFLSYDWNASTDPVFDFFKHTINLYPVVLHNKYSTRKDNYSVTLINYGIYNDDAFRLISDKRLRIVAGFTSVTGKSPGIQYNPRPLTPDMISKAFRDVFIDFTDWELKNAIVIIGDRNATAQVRFGVNLGDAKKKQLMQILQRYYYSFIVSQSSTPPPK